MKKPLMIVAMVAAVVLIVVAGVAAASTSGDTEENATGSDADKAAAAAVTEVGGNALGVEAGDNGNAAYEVEVKTATGEVEVLVDSHFAVISSQGDDTDANEAANEAEDRD